MSKATLTIDADNDEVHLDSELSVSEWDGKTKVQTDKSLLIGALLFPIIRKLMNLSTEDLQKKHLKELEEKLS